MLLQNPMGMAPPAQANQQSQGGLGQIGQMPDIQGGLLAQLSALLNGQQSNQQTPKGRGAAMGLKGHQQRAEDALAEQQIADLMAQQQTVASPYDAPGALAMLPPHLQQAAMAPPPIPGGDFDKLGSFSQQALGLAGIGPGMPDQRFGPVQLPPPRPAPAPQAPPQVPVGIAPPQGPLVQPTPGVMGPMAPPGHVPGPMIPGGGSLLSPGAAPVSRPRGRAGTVGRGGGGPKGRAAKGRRGGR